MRALDEVSLFVAKADASRQRKPVAPTVAHIEAYCAAEQRKIELLLEEVEAMKADGGDADKQKKGECARGAVLATVHRVPRGSYVCARRHKQALWASARVGGVHPRGSDV
eukprot:5825130-Prymnesium_polylepis.1